MSGTQRLMEAFHNWALLLVPNPEENTQIILENTNLNVLKQLLIILDHNYFKSTTQTTSIKFIQSRLCQYSSEVLRIPKQPLLAQDYTDKVTSLKLIILFKLTFRIINQREIPLKIHSLLKDDRKLLDHFIKSLDLTKEKGTHISAQFQKTVKKQLSEDRRMLQENEILKRELTRCYDIQKRLAEQNLHLKAQIQNVKSQKQIADGILNELKGRMEMMEEIILQLSEQIDASDSQPYYKQHSDQVFTCDISQTDKNNAFIKHAENDVHQEQQLTDRKRTQSNISNSTNAEVAKERYQKLKKIHFEFRQTIKSLTKK